MRVFCIFLLGFAVRAAIILTSPITWGGDTIIRLFDRHTLVKAHQLPMLQVLISGVSVISMDPALVRYMVAIIGALAGVGFYWVIADLYGEKSAFLAAVLFVTHPYVLAVSTVPFQEILMLTGMLGAFHFFYTRQWLAASLSLAVACLTRYESWVACPVLAFAYVVHQDRSIKGVAKAALLFGWVPVVWILVNHGLTQTGHFVIDRSLSIWRLQRFVYLGWITAKFSQLPVLLLAGAGAWRLYRNRSLIDRQMQVQIAVVALFSVAVLFSAHGVMPDPERYVTSREAYLPMYFVLVLAAAGLAQWPRWNAGIVGSSAILGVAAALLYVHTQTSDPALQLDYSVAQYLDHYITDGERALLLTKPLTQDLVEPYLEKLRQIGTEEDTRQAEREIAADGLTPPDYQRVVVYSHLGRGRLVAPPVSCAEWIVVWNDYPEAGRELAGVRPVQVLRSGPLLATILRRQCLH